MSEKKIEPCVYCGNETVFAERKGVYYGVQCACGHRGRSHLTKKAAIEDWNLRYSLTQMAEEDDNRR